LTIKALHLNICTRNRFIFVQVKFNKKAFLAIAEIDKKKKIKEADIIKN